MNDLSPAAQHILKDLPTSPHLQMFNRAYAAAVIRSAAEQVKSGRVLHPDEQWIEGFKTGTSTASQYLTRLADELEGTKDWPACQHIVPTDNEIPTLVSCERLDEVKLGDRIWQAYMNTKKEEQQ